MNKQYAKNPADLSGKKSTEESTEKNRKEGRDLDEAVRERLEKLANNKERITISLTNDFAFKHTFHNKKALKGLLSALLRIPAEEIVSLEFPDRVLPGEYAEDKEGFLDVRVLLNNDKKINVEIQIKKYLFWEERSLFYNCKLFVDNLKKGMHYSNLETCIHISILNFDLSEGDGLYSEIELRNIKNGRPYSDKFSFRVLYLNHVNDADEEEKQTDIYKWARMISTKDWEVLREMAACNEYTKAALEELERINSDSSLRYHFLQSEMAESDIATYRLGVYIEAKAEGIAEGKAEGKAEGIAEGKAEGKVEGKAEGEERVSQLNLKLLAEKKYGELEKASGNKLYRDELLEKYKL